MGFFDSLVTAVNDASETAHGTRLLREFDDSIRRIAPLDGRDEIIRRFVYQRTIIRREMHNWSRDGTLSQATDLRRKARQTFDLNVVDGYSLWLTSAWLEASVRRSADAQHVWQQLDQLAAQHDAIEAHAELIARAQKAVERAKEDVKRKRTERAKLDARREREEAAHTLGQAVERQRSLLRESLADSESIATIGSLRKAVRRIVEIGFKTTSAPDLRHVNWGSSPSRKVIACCVGFGISSAEAALSEPALHIAFCASYLETQGCGPEMRKCFTRQSINEYYVQPDGDLGVVVLAARDAMDAYLDGDRSALEALKSAFD